MLRSACEFQRAPTLSARRASPPIIQYRDSELRQAVPTQTNADDCVLLRPIRGHWGAYQGLLGPMTLYWGAEAPLARLSWNIGAKSSALSAQERPPPGTWPTLAPKARAETELPWVIYIDTYFFLDVSTHLLICIEILRSWYVGFADCLCRRLYQHDLEVCLRYVVP